MQSLAMARGQSLLPMLLVLVIVASCLQRVVHAQQPSDLEVFMRERQHALLFPSEGQKLNEKASMASVQAHIDPKHDLRHIRDENALGQISEEDARLSEELNVLRMLHLEGGRFKDRDLFASALDEGNNVLSHDETSKQTVLLKYPVTTVVEHLEAEEIDQTIRKALPQMPTRSQQFHSIVLNDAKPRLKTRHAALLSRLSTMVAGDTAEEALEKLSAKSILILKNHIQDEAYSTIEDTRYVDQFAAAEMTRLEEKGLIPVLKRHEKKIVVVGFENKADAAENWQLDDEMFVLLHEFTVHMVLSNFKTDAILDAFRYVRLRFKKPSAAVQRTYVSTSLATSAYTEEDGDFPEYR